MGIEGNNGRITGYNPKTGEPICAEQVVTGYDPRTGKPIYAEQIVTGYDPHTGAPIYAPPEQVIMGYDPQTGAPVYEAAQGGRQKKPFNWKPLLVVGIVAAAVIIVAAVFLSTPKIALGLAARNTMADAQKIFGRYDEATGYNKVAKPLLESDYTMDSKFRLYGAGDYYLPDGSGLDIRFDRSLTDKAAALEVGVVGQDVKLVEIDVYADEQYLEAGIPQLFDGMLRMETEDVVSQYNGSYFAGQTGKLDMADFSLDFFDPDKGDMYPQKIRDAYLEYAQDALESVRKQVVFGKGESAEKEAFGQTRNCKAYTVTVPQRAIRKLIRSVGDFAAQDKTVEEYIDASINSVAFAYPFGGATESKSEVYRLMAEYFGQAEDAVEEDLFLTFYTTKGRIVSMECEWDIADVVSNISLEMDLTGIDNPWEEYEFRFDAKANVAGNIPFGINVRGEEETSREELASTLKMAVSADHSEEIAATLKRSYDTSSGDFSFSARYGAGSMAVDVRLGGSMGVDKNAFVTAIDSFKLNLGSASIDVDVEGDVAIRPLQEAPRPTDDPIDIFELSESEIGSLGMEIADNVGGSLLGGIMPSGLLDAVPAADPLDDILSEVEDQFASAPVPAVPEDIPIIAEAPAVETDAVKLEASFPSQFDGNAYHVQSGPLSITFKVTNLTGSDLRDIVISEKNAGEIGTLSMVAANSDNILRTSINIAEPGEYVFSVCAGLPDGTQAECQMAPVPISIAAEEVPDTAGAGRVIGSGKLVLLTNAAYPPFEYLGADGQVAGIDVDVCEAVAQEMGVPLEIVNMDFEGLLPALEAGRGDLVASAMTPTELRAASADFSDPYAGIGQKIVVKKGNTTITGEEGLIGMAVGIKTGSLGDLYASNADNWQLLLVDIRKYSSETAALADLKSGALDAVVLDTALAESLTETDDTLALVDMPSTDAQYAIAVRKGDEELLHVVNGVIGQLKADGSLDRWTAAHLAAV